MEIKMETLMSRSECKNTMLGLVDEVAKCCESNDISYYLGYGTLLGAVRHKGFIPWDDDIDLYMDRASYSRFIGGVKSGELVLPHWIEVLDDTIDEYYYPFAKIVDTRTKAKMENNLTEHGIWIDVFPMDNSSDNIFLSRLQVDICLLLRAAIISATTDFSANNLGKKRIIKRLIMNTVKVIGIKRILALQNAIAKSSENKDTVCSVNYFSPYGMKERMPKKYLFEKTYLEFEGRTLSASKYFDFCLKNLYGEYMELPPENKRRTHSITATRIE